MMPLIPQRILLYVHAFFSEYGRRPKLSELPHKLQEAFGKWYFEIHDWARIHKPEWSDDFVYVGAVDHAGLERDRPDAVDARHTAPWQWSPDPTTPGLRNGTPIRYVGGGPVDKEGMPVYALVKNAGEGWGA